jgi:REP element-mobilizing transposase RayT
MGTQSKIWIHTIWQTINRLPLILPEIEPKIYKIVNDEFINSACKVEVINGTADHIHILYLLNPDISISNVTQQIQLESSKLINAKCFNAGSFDWYIENLSISVSESQIPKLIEYLKNQKEFHKGKSFLQENNEFKRLHGIMQL